MNQTKLLYLSSTDATEPNSFINTIKLENCKFKMGLFQSDFFTYSKVWCIFIQLNFKING